jgi:hypothetical protein
MWKLVHVVCQTEAQSGLHRVKLGGSAAVGEKQDDNMVIPALFAIGGMNESGPKNILVRIDQILG